MRNYKYIKQIKFLENECFYGGIVRNGVLAPYDCNSDIEYCLSDTIEGDTFGGVFVSNMGRYVKVIDGDCYYAIKGGVMTIKSNYHIEYAEGFGTLKNAFIELNKTFNKTPLKTPKYLLTAPQFCTWTSMGIDVTQDKIEKYCQTVSDNGFPYALFIIDDGWMTDYGDWSFDQNKFSNPKRMIELIHGLGFKVSMWLVPFVNEKCKNFELLKNNGGLITDSEGQVYLAKWWNGQSALLDMTSPFTKKWLKDVLDNLVNEYGVDGFKFDGGGARFYINVPRVEQYGFCIQQSKAWAEFAMQYECSELKEYCYYPASHVITRLNDKRRNWDRNQGIGSLVPNMINAGLCGCYYTCADMIGGGQISDFTSGVEFNDFEVIIRFCECSALMPCMQFSHDYWSEKPDIKEIFLKYSKLHAEFGEYIAGLIDEAQDMGLPIIRSLEFEFPHQGFSNVNDAFMLGSDYLVAPVITKGAREVTLELPKGYKWQYCPTGEVYCSGKVTVSAPLDVLPYFKKING